MNHPPNGPRTSTWSPPVPSPCTPGGTRRVTGPSVGIGGRSPSDGRGGSPSVTVVPLLQPRVAQLVVAALLPEPRLVVVEQPDAADPLRALPEVQVRHEHPDRAAV